MLREHEPTDELFRVLLKFHEKSKQLVHFDHQSVNSLCSCQITSATRADSVFSSSYRNTIFNQSPRVLLGAI